MSVLLDGITALYGAAVGGDVHAVAVAIRRLLGRLRQVDPALADALKTRLPVGGSSQVRSAAGALPLAPRDVDNNFGLLREIPTADALRPVVRAPAERVLAAFLLEHRSVEQLAAQGLRPRSTLLLSGPPGVGKTMASAWLASELGLPLYQVELSGLMSSYLGRTGQNLREIFDFARTNSVVLLMDEFDAVGKRRDDLGDLGEVRRIVSVLLKEIEEWPGPSVLVAATNFASSLDPAVTRRFQTVLEIEPPGVEEAWSILTMHLGATKPTPSVQKLASELLAARSGSDIRNFAQEARRRLALEPTLTMDQALLHALATSATTPLLRRRFAKTARVVMKGATFSVLADVLGVSKGTIHTYLKGDS